jgi:putative holliday junction resolvase
MRILAIDHGLKRIGVAVSDPSGIIAQPLEQISAEPFQGFLDRLRAIIREKEVEMILVGMPRNMDGSHGEAAERVRQFVLVLGEAITVPLKTWDERLTTMQANRLLAEANVRGDKRKARVDKTAAAILLQSYLDSVAR